MITILELARVTIRCPRLVACCAALLVACSSDDGDGSNDIPQGGVGGALGVDGGPAGAGAGGANEPDDAMPDYGVPTIEPDTSTEKVADCADAPDMTLCDVVTTPDRWYDVCVSGVCVSPGCGEKSCNTPGPHYRIPPFEGHVYLEKQPGEEPVTIDKITGLYWTSCAAGLTGAGCDGGAPLDLELEEALAYCDELNWGGYDDWYLPDIFELTSLADLTADASTTTGLRADFLDDRAFPNQQAVTALYWSTSIVNNDEMAFNTGQYAVSFPSIADYVSFPPNPALCVRRGFSKAMPEGERFVSHDNVPDGQPWTEDRATGLVFQGCSSGPSGMCDGMFTAAESVAHCRDLSWGGADDWRVANYKELQGVFDPYEVFTPLPPEFFGELRGPYVFAAPDALLGLDDMKRVGIGFADKTYPVLCVRGPYTP